MVVLEKINSKIIVLEKITFEGMYGELHLEQQIFQTTKNRPFST